MGPDWFTVIAQIINFLILVALLKRFLYGPIVKAMDRREAEISSRLDAAAGKAADAEREKARYEGLSMELARQQDDLRAQARDEAAALRAELIAKAREEANRCGEQWRESLRRERESLLHSLQRHLCEQTCAVARRVLAEMADASLEERMAACLEQRIRQLPRGEREEWAAGIRASGQDITVRSAFELTAGARSTLLRALKNVTDAPEPRFEVEPSLVCGIEIVAAGRALTWSVEDNLGDLEERLVDVVEREWGGSGQSFRQTNGHGN